MELKPAYSSSALIKYFLKLISSRSIIDVATALIAIVVVLLLIFLKKIPEPFIIAAAAVAGLAIKLFQKIFYNYYPINLVD